jgi:hypothetical protein
VDTKITEFKILKSNITQEIIPASIKGQRIWPDFPFRDTITKKRAAADALLLKGFEGL